MLQDHYRGGQTEKMVVTIITVDPANGRIEGVGRDAAVIQIQPGGIGALMRWPIERETWIVRRENGVWMLDSVLENEQWWPKTSGSLTMGDGLITANRLYMSNGGEVLNDLSSNFSAFGYIDVQRQYGAKGDGIADDAPAIQAAINAAYTLVGDKVVYFRAGTYRVATKLQLKEGVTLMGHHNPRWFAGVGNAPISNCKIVASTGVTSAVIEVMATSVAVRFGRIQGLCIDGNYVAGPVHGISFQGQAQEFRLHDVEIVRCTGNGLFAQTGGIGQPQNIVGSFVYSHHNNDCGFQFVGGADCYFHRCVSHSNAVSGWWLNGLHHSEFWGCTSEWNTFNGYDVLGSTGGIEFNGCRTDRNGNHGWKFAQTSKQTCSIVGGVAHRDGRSFSSAMVRLQGSAGNLVGPVTVTGLVGHVGKDDNGSGTESPDYGLRASFADRFAWTGGTMAGVLAVYSDAGSNTAGAIVYHNVVTAVGTEAAPTFGFVA